MSKNSPSAQFHRLLRFLAREAQYRMYGPLIGPKEKHQPNPRWEGRVPNVFEQGMTCPRCGEQADTIIQQLGKPTRYVHAQNNQDPIVHLDLTEDLKVEGEPNA